MSSTRTQWYMTGEAIVSCNCAWGCPCQFNARPTYGRCEGFGTYRVLEGSYGSVKLDGVLFADLLSFPGPIHEGKGTARLIIDSRATLDQRRALDAIATGKEGGMFFEIIAAVCSKFLETAYAPINFAVDRDKRTAAVRIPGIAETTVEPIRNPVTRQEHRARIVLPGGFEFREAEMGNTVHFTVNSDPILMDHSNSYAQLNRFDWRNTV